MRIEFSALKMVRAHELFYAPGSIVLDLLNPGLCLAVIPQRGGLSVERIAAVPGCVHVAPVDGKWRAVYRGSPAETDRRLARELGITDAIVTRASLEELFSDLVGESRRAVGADEAILPTAGRRAGVR